MKKTILVFLSILLLSGCADFLDTSLDTNPTSETIETNRNTLWNLANAFYSPITYGYSVIDNNIFASASDEAQQTAVSSNVLYFNKGILNEGVNPLFYLYRNYYEGIRAANYFLDYVKDGKGEELLKLNRNIENDIYSYMRDVASLNWYIAEAHIARAYYYSELIKMYGAVPIIEKTIEQSDNEKVTQSSYDQVVEYILNEIDTYSGELAVNWDEFADREGRFTLGAALAIKSRVLLYAASPLHNPEGNLNKWIKAAEAARDFIDNEELDYSLDQNYGTYFIGANSLSSPETIYAVRRGVSNSMEVNNYPISTPGGYSGVTPSHNLVSAYEYVGEPDPNNPYANRDPRLYASVVTNGSTWNDRVIDQLPGGSDDMTKANASRTGYYLKKFLTDNLNLIQGQTAQHNWVAYRYAEILLNYAEAMNEAFGPTDVPAGFTLSATDAINMVRNRASADLPLISTESKDEFRSAIKHERRIELAFEDHRYWDLLRWKDAMQVLNQPIMGVKVVEDGESVNYVEIKVADRVFNERNYYLPFLRSEIVNSNNTLKQNEGY
ncbi:RagB/SusD family nutrient uptake outer membrane protein [Lascolabacillus massiliensis]|uniref:RagB/SusD family nutrient uptake outer membrane protein n=1 Tax=Lascolabacillus massiliensis TaxID=1627894 RepID=UPI0018D09000|nr:RagB/SusD family nutrient uptake outer membrane protein [Lascolabacillus massiliensis]